MADDAELELPRGVALAWGVAADPQRGPKREMSVEKIVDAAVELADAEGLGAVSMAAVAAKLGYTPMSLYRYVSAKDDLVLLMQESATGVPPHSLRDVTGWRERLRAIFHAQLMIYLEHPWMLDIPITGSPITPNSSGWMDATLDALSGTPLTEEERMAATLLVTGHVRWYGTILAAYSAVSRNSGLTPAQITVQEAAIFESLITAEEFPALRRAVEAGVFLSEADPFTFGLERILDGIAAYTEALGAGRPHDPDRSWEALPDADVAADKRVREARKAVREAEKALRDAQKLERLAVRDARDRLARQTS